MNPTEAEEKFQALATIGRELRDRCSHHYASVTYFWSGGSRFMLDQTEVANSRREANDQPTHEHSGTERLHLTTSATCIQSLLHCAEEFRPDLKPDETAEALARNFAVSTLALGLEHKHWRTCGSARVYCRCRALPLAISHLDRANQVGANVRPEDVITKIGEHVAAIWHHVQKGERAVGEDELQHNSVSDKQEDAEWLRDWTNQRLAGQPNPYLTFWALRAFRNYHDFLRVPQHTTLHDGLLNKLKDETDSVHRHLLLDNGQEPKWDNHPWVKSVRAWIRENLGVQIALHVGGSSNLDSDQLGWLLAAYSRFYPDIWVSPVERELVRQGIICFFGAQSDVGIWRRGSPLFQFQEEGDAYAYPFETLSELLKSALHTDHRFLRLQLREHLPNLLRLSDYAWDRRVTLSEETGAVGWYSGLHMRKKKHGEHYAEAWATACVFEFFHHLRRLVGIWTKEVAFSIVRRQQPTTQTTPFDAVQTIRQRGSSWVREEDLTIAEDLMSLFVNPILIRQHSEKRRLDPFRHVIKKDQPRSAILFGPPGTSKTTLARMAARALQWDYVEIRFSDFLIDGMDYVDRTANRIFSYLMELDQTVILFDEVDELLRSRIDTKGEKAELWNRFLTTSMLPRLAELWDQRRVLYFVATNQEVSEFDPAIVRGQRFDALLPVAPAGWDSKREKLKNELKKRRGAAPEISLDNSLSAQNIRHDRILSKLILMRWDEMDEVAHHLADILPAGEATVTGEHLREAVERTGPQREVDASKVCDALLDLRQVDFRSVRAWFVASGEPNSQSGSAPGGEKGPRPLLTGSPRTKLLELGLASEVHIKGSGTPYDAPYEPATWAVIHTSMDFRTPHRQSGLKISRHPIYPGCVVVEPEGSGTGNSLARGSNESGVSKEGAAANPA